MSTIKRADARVRRLGGLALAGALGPGSAVGCPIAAPPDAPPPIERPAPPPEPAPAPAPAPPPAPAMTPSVARPSAGARTEDEQNSIDVFHAVAPATVFVTNKQIVRDRWSARALEVPAGTGSGFIWDAKGHVVTNAHVVANGRSFEVTDHQGKAWPARLVGVDPAHDIAVLAIDVPEGTFTAVRLPPEDHVLAVGQKTLAIGNPFGLDHTLTIGIVSALGREIVGFGGLTIRGMIQTDASINPGNSGGPLLDSAGQLIGMNTMIFSKSGTSAGIGFAVPVSEIRRLVPDLIQYGQPRRAGLGISIAPDELTRRNGIEGVVILEAAAGSPAAKAGLIGIRKTQAGVWVGDIIVGIDGERVGRWDDLYKVLDARRPGDVVELTVERDGDRRQVEVKLTELVPP